MKSFIGSLTGVVLIASVGFAQEKQYHYYHPTNSGYSNYPSYSYNRHVGHHHDQFQHIESRSQFDETLSHHWRHRRNRRTTYLPYKLGGFYLWYRWIQHRR